MRLIGFAHLTMVGGLQPKLVETGLISSSPELTASFSDLVNPSQKQNYQLSRRETYSLNIFKGLIPLEMLSFSNTSADWAEGNLGIGVSVSGPEVTLSSSSFGRQFADGICSLFSLDKPAVPIVAGRQRRYVRFDFDPNSPEFSGFLDEQNRFVSVAFFVRGLSGANLAQFGTSFRIGIMEIGGSSFNVSFVRLGGCWVELLERESCSLT